MKLRTQSGISFCSTRGLLVAYNYNFKMIFIYHIILLFIATQMNLNKDDKCFEVFQEMKMKKAHRFLVFKIESEKVVMNVAILGC